MQHSEFFEGSNIVSEMEISRAFLMMAEGLQFMHNVQKRLHLNLTPESIVITALGHWKLCGFGFSLSFQQGDLQRIPSPYFLKPLNLVNGVSTALVRLEPDLRYAAPETTEGGYNPPGVRNLTPVADVFSLALTIYDVYRFNLKMSPNERTCFRSFLTIVNNDASQYSSAMDQMRLLDYTFLPLGIDRLLMGLLNPTAVQRLSANEIVNNAFFVTGNQAVISAIEKLHTKDIGSQTTQLMNFQNQLDSFPPRLLKFTVLPAIGQLCVSVPSLWEFGLPIFEASAHYFSRDQFQAIAGQYFAAGMALTTNVETMQAFLNSLPFIQQSFGLGFFQVMCLFWLFEFCD
jgi:SCY1-like protein 2